MWYGQAVDAAGALVAVEGPNEPNNFRSLPEPDVELLHDVRAVAIFRETLTLP